MLPDFITGAKKSSEGKSSPSSASTPVVPSTVAPVIPKTDVPSNSTQHAQIEQLFQSALAAQRAKRNNEALTTYRQLLQLKPDVVEARVNLALLLMEMKRPDEALSQLREAQKTDRKNAAVAFQIAQILLGQKRPREAVEPLKSVVALAPKNPQGWATLAQTQAALNQRDRAIESWKRVAALLPNDARAPLAIATLAGDAERLGEAERWARKAVQLARKGAPRDPRPAFVLGRVLAARQKLREAENVLRDGLKQFPDALEIGTTLSDVRWRRGDKSGSIATMQSLLPRVPATRDGGGPRAQLLAQIARLQATNKQPKAAAQTLQSATQILPRNAELRSLLGEALLRSGDKKGGIAQLRNALALEPKRVELRWPLARALAASGDWKAADIEYSTMRRTNKDANKNAELLSEHAQVQEKNKQPQKALTTWRELAAVAPKSPLPLLQQGRLLHNSKRDDEALRVYNSALELRPNEPNALLGAAQIESKRDKTRALKLWTSLAQTRPDFSPAYGRAMFLAVAQRQSVATANALKTPLRRQVENRQAFGAVLRGLLDANEIEAAKSLVKEFRSRFPKAKAPQWAEAALDVELKKREIAITERRQGASSTPEKTTDEETPRPRWTPRPLDAPSADTNASTP